MPADHFHFHPAQTFYRGKVRDVYSIGQTVIMVASDRISAFDHILPRDIPYKGDVLNGIAAYHLRESASIVPTWLDQVLHPKVSAGKLCEPIKLEMVVRGYLAGHAWRTYMSGERMLCGVKLAEGLKEADRLEQAIITPATKADEGHDEDISAVDILEQKIVPEHIWQQLCDYSLQLFDLGTRLASERGLLLVDTKYEFGLYEGNVHLIDEIHTPDSSRYYVADGYEERQAAGEPQQQLSKEFVREWLMDHGFQGLEGQTMPEMPDAFVKIVSDRYIDLYERLTGQSFDRRDVSTEDEDIISAVQAYLG